MSDHIPKHIFQVHSNAYRNSSQLPSGAVLVVGSGASGCQIADDLQKSGRQVYLFVGRHSRRPRRYRGKDFAYWGPTLGTTEQVVDTVPEQLRKGSEILLTGANRRLRCRSARYGRTRNSFVRPFTSHQRW